MVQSYASKPLAAACLQENALEKHMPLAAACLAWFFGSPGTMRLL
jgi:hypothetical protein